jgi:hypothetical protein
MRIDAQRVPIIYARETAKRLRASEWIGWLDLTFATPSADDSARNP